MRSTFSVFRLTSCAHTHQIQTHTHTPHVQHIHNCNTHNRADSFPQRCTRRSLRPWRPLHHDGAPHHWRLRHRRCGLLYTQRALAADRVRTTILRCRVSCVVWSVFSVSCVVCRVSCVFCMSLSRTDGHCSKDSVLRELSAVFGLSDPNVRTHATRS